MDFVRSPAFSPVRSPVYRAAGTPTGTFGDPTRTFYTNFQAPSLPSAFTFTRASAATDIINGVLTSFATDTPRISAYNGLLLEESRTNLATNSNMAATNGGSLTAGQSDPAGGTGAGLFTENTATTGHQAGFGSTIGYVSGTTYVASMFLKKGTCDKVQIFLSASVVTTADAYANFDLTNGIVTATGAGANSAAVQPLANGWYRCSLRFTANATATNAVLACTLSTGLEGRAPSSITGTSRTYYLYGAQVEAGQFLTSFIPTTTAAATRAADVCTAAVGSWYNASEGTLFVDVLSGPGTNPSAGTSPRLIRLDDGTAANVHEIRRNSADSVLRGVTTTASVDQSIITGAALGNNTQVRAAYAYKNNDMAFCQAGGSVGTDLTGTMPTGLTNLRIGATSTPSGFFNGYIREVAFYNVRKSNADLQALTA